MNQDILNNEEPRNNSPLTLYHTIPALNVLETEGF